MAKYGDREVRVGGFAEVMRGRVRAARAAVAAAEEAGDAYALAVAADELDDALRLARANGVTVEPEADGAEGVEGGGR